MSLSSEDIGLLNQLETPVLEIVLDQARIAYRTQETMKSSAPTQPQPNQQEENE